jgi:hypothetical protein
MPPKGKTPDAKAKRFKCFLYGPAGVGKTTAAIQFKDSYIVDMEHGCDLYSESIIKSNSVLFQSTNPDEVKAEIKSLLTEPHQYKTLVIDPATIFYQALQEKWNRTFEKWSEKEKQSDLQDFGFRYWAKVKSEYKAFMRLLLSLDMNVILTSHQKTLWSNDAGGNLKAIGTQPDTMKGDEYLFDYIFQLAIDGKGKRIATVKKERAEVGKAKFPTEFEWSYKNFIVYYGQEALERESVPVPLATPEQVAKVKELLGIVKVEETFEADCLNKADVDTWDELTSEKIQKTIDFLNKKLTGGK